MLRDPALIPLSHQHQHALALCVRIDRAPRSTPSELSAWQAEIVSLFEQEIRFHFDAEERILFPAAERFAELRQLVADLRRDHDSLRGKVASAAAHTMSAADLKSFADHLATHVRREERELFEAMQKLFSTDELHELGTLVDAEFRANGIAGPTCRIQPKR
jgi:hemerythrin-like domain-containing protein